MTCNPKILKNPLNLVWKHHLIIDQGLKNFATTKSLQVDFKEPSQIS